MLIHYHLKVFGPVLYTNVSKFILVSYQNDGSKQISNVLNQLITSKKYSKQELGKDSNKFNIIIRPISLPQYELEIVSTSLQTNKSVLDNVVTKLDNIFSDAGFFTLA